MSHDSSLSVGQRWAQLYFMFSRLQRMPLLVWLCCVSEPYPSPVFDTVSPVPEEQPAVVCRPMCVCRPVQLWRWPGPVELVRSSALAKLLWTLSALGSLCRFPPEYTAPGGERIWTRLPFTHSSKTKEKCVGNKSFFIKFTFLFLFLFFVFYYFLLFTIA